MSKKSKTLAPRTFNAPGLGYELAMDEHGQVYTVNENGVRVSKVAFRDEDGVWHLIKAFPILNHQQVDTLEQEYRSQ